MQHKELSRLPDGMIYEYVKSSGEESTPVTPPSRPSTPKRGSSGTYAVATGGPNGPSRPKSPWPAGDGEETPKSPRFSGFGHGSFTKVRDKMKNAMGMSELDAHHSHFLLLLLLQELLRRGRGRDGQRRGS